MTDEQVQVLADAFIKSTFQEDLIVAIVSGLIILLASSLVSYFISKHEGKKAKEEAKERIRMETEGNLASKRIFYLEQVELQDYLNLENELEKMKKLAQEFTEKYIDSEEFNRVDIFDRIAPTLPYNQKASTFKKIVLNVTKQYDFSESEASIIKNSAEYLADYISGVLEHSNLSIYDDVEVFEDLISKLDHSWDVISNKRFKLYERMKHKN